MRKLEWLLLITGFTLLAATLIRSGLARRHQSELQRDLKLRMKQPPRAAEQPRFPWRLQVPRLHLSVMVQEGADAGSLRTGVGHIEKTAYPGQPGNIGLAAHRDTYFRPIRSIQLGDRIVLDTADRKFFFTVTSIEIVTPKDTQVLAPGTHPMLTLVTCYPFNYIGSAPKRFIVHAVQLPARRDDESPFEGSRPTQPHASNYLRGDQ